MYKLSEESFNYVEKLVASKGNNYNQDRCFIIPVGFREDEVTCCLDEIESELRICQVNGKDTEFKEDKFFSDRLIERSKKAIYSTVERAKYEEYKEVTKMQSECCSKGCECCRGMIEY